MKKIILILLFLSSCIGASKNSAIEENKKGYFPSVVGIDLEGDLQQFPQVFSKAKLNLVIVAFKREQQKEIDAINPQIQEFLKNNPEINFYELPVIYEVSALKRAWVNNAMRYGVNKNSRSKIITIYTNREKFFKIMNMEKDSIYILLIDNQGKILSFNKNSFDEKSILKK